MLKDNRRILVIDIEWAPALAYVWRFYDENINPEQLIDHGGIGFIQIDTGYIGGIGAAYRVAQYAQTQGVQFVNHTFTSQSALSASLSGKFR